MTWTADIGNDPSRDFALCVDLMEDNEHRATVSRKPDGHLMLTVFPSEEMSINIPVQWLIGIFEMAERDIVNARDDQ